MSFHAFLDFRVSAERSNEILPSEFAFISKLVFLFAAFFIL
jgi:hypothetical protein